MHHMTAILRRASELQLALDRILDSSAMRAGVKSLRALHLVWHLLQLQLAVAPLRFPPDSLSLTALQAAEIMYGASRFALASLRPALRCSTAEGLQECDSMLQSVAETLHVLDRFVATLSLRAGGSACVARFAVLAALLELLRFCVRDDDSHRRASLDAALAQLRRAPASSVGHAIAALCLWFGGDAAAAASEAEKAVHAAQKEKDGDTPEVAAASLALALYVRGEARRAVVARGDGAPRSFEWVDDLKRADRENPIPAVVRLSAQSLQAAVAVPKATPAKLAQVATTILTVFDELGLDLPCRGTDAPQLPTDAEWAAHLDGVASLLTYFPTAASFLAGLGLPGGAAHVALHDVAALDKHLRDERLGKLRSMALQIEQEPRCSVHVAGGNSAKGAAARASPPPEPGSSDKQMCHNAEKKQFRTQHRQADPMAAPDRSATPPTAPQSSSGSRPAAPMFFRRYTSATEADKLRTRQSRSFMYQRPDAAGTTPRQFTRFRSFSSGFGVE